MYEDETTLVTGTAGFNGSHIFHTLLDDGYNVVGIDNFDIYYDVNPLEMWKSKFEARPGLSGIGNEMAKVKYKLGFHPTRVLKEATGAVDLCCKTIVQ